MRTVCPGLCVLRFKYIAARTRRTIVTSVGTSLSNHCLHQDYWFYFLNPSISSLLCCVLVHICLKALTEDFLNFPSSIFFSLFVFILFIPCFRFLYSVFVYPFHHDDYAYVMLCLHLSTYSAASSSSLRNFLTLKFLSEEFIKIAYSPPL